MKFQLKRLLTVVMTVALVLGLGYFSWDRQLRASDSAGDVTAAEQQLQAEQTNAPEYVNVVEIEEATVAEEPVVEEPVAEEPVVEEPVVEEPVAEEPVAEEPAVEEPVAEEPVAEEPVAEEPVAEEPAAEEPVAEEPVTEEPVAEEPVTEEPVAEEPVQADPFQNASVHVWLMTKGDLYFGDTATLFASVNGVADGASYSLQWQTDYGEGWENIPGATGNTYSFTMTNSNVDLPYRAVMICN